MLHVGGAIDSDEKLVDVLDELSHQLKMLSTPLGLAFRAKLSEFIRQHKLDGDADMFASLPTRDASR